MNRRIRRGATTVEMTLVGIPIVFMLICIFEVSRGMWLYDTAAHAVREGMRFAIVHGVNCVNNPPTVTNNCAKTVAQVAQIVRDHGIGLDPNTASLRFTAPSPGGAVVNCTLTACASNTSIWPPAIANSVGTILQMDITVPYNSALAMFWPGAAKVDFATISLGATSLDTVQF